MTGQLDKKTNKKQMACLDGSPGEKLKRNMVA